MKALKSFSFLKRRTLVVNNDYISLKPLIAALPETFDKEGKTLYHKRNIIKESYMDGYHVVIKSFKLPNWINRIIYGSIRSSKAARSYKYSLKLQKLGIDVPNPIGYIQFREYGLFTESYFISEFSKCRYTYNTLFNQPKDIQEKVLTAIGKLVAHMHQNKVYHLDLSGGNILFDINNNNKIVLELLDLNRMRFGKVSVSQGCKNFERLDASPEDLIIMGSAYAQTRGFNPQQCINKILIFNHRYHR